MLKGRDDQARMVLDRINWDSHKKELSVEAKLELEKLLETKEAACGRNWIKTINNLLKWNIMKR